MSISINELVVILQNQLNQYKMKLDKIDIMFDISFFIIHSNIRIKKIVIKRSDILQLMETNSWNQRQAVFEYICQITGVVINDRDRYLLNTMNFSYKINDAYLSN